MSFENLGLSAELLRAVAEQGYTTPTPIQAQVIPVVLAARDVLAGAQTGTGKTAGFTLPLLQRLVAAPLPPQGNRRPVRALILTPTRELAAQVGESVKNYGRYVPLKSAIIFGGVSINPQIDTLRRGVDILIATPGRLLDHAKQRHVDLSQVEIFVLDEADRMLDMGFLPDIRRVIAMLPQQRQNLLFSATFPDDIRGLANKMLRNPASVEIGKRNAAAIEIEQMVYHVEKSRKRDTLSWLIGSRNWPQVLVFTRTKHGANRLAEQLVQDGLSAAAIHGNKSQGARTKALADFKSGAVRVLVATDIAARGIDIDELPHVVNFDLPEVPEHYVHRIGRTGRAGNTGAAVSLVAGDDRPLLKQIERLLNRSLPVGALDGVPPPSARPEQPLRSDQRHRQGGQHQGRGERSQGGQRQGHGGQRSQSGEQRGQPGQQRSHRSRSGGGGGGRGRPAARSGGGGGGGGYQR